MKELIQIARNATVSDWICGMIIMAMPFAFLWVTP